MVCTPKKKSGARNTSVGTFEFKTTVTNCTVKASASTLALSLTHQQGLWSWPLCIAFLRESYRTSLRQKYSALILLFVEVLIMRILLLRFLGEKRQTTVLWMCTILVSYIGYKLPVSGAPTVRCLHNRCQGRRPKQQSRGDRDVNQCRLFSAWISDV